MTGFVIADLLLDNDWFGAQQIVIGSASSKTGFSTAAFVRAAGFEGAIVGLTSDQNVAFSEALGCYDRVVSYSCLLYTSPSPRDGLLSRMPSSA